MLRKQLIWQDCEWHLTRLPLIFARRMRRERERKGNQTSIQTYREKKLLMMITYTLLVNEFSIN